MKILTLDTETSPMTAYTWSMFKATIGLNQIIDTSRLLCFSAKWLDEKKVMSFSEWDDGQEAMIQAAWDLLDEADAVVSYNGKRFDSKVIRKEFVKAGLTPPSPYKEIDLFETNKAQFRFNSGKLDHIAQELGLGSKLSHEGFQLWVDSMNGVEKAQRKMSRYCAQDVKLTEKLYKRLLPWIKSHPNRSLYDGAEALSCPSCGSKHIQRRGYAYTRVSRFQKFVCNDCGKWSRAAVNDVEKEERVNVLREVS